MNKICISLLAVLFISCGFAENPGLWVEAVFLKKQYADFFTVLGVKANCEMTALSLNSNNKGDMWEAIAHSTCGKAKSGLAFSGSAKCEKNRLYILCK